MYAGCRDSRFNKSIEFVRFEWFWKQFMHCDIAAGSRGGAFPCPEMVLRVLCGW
jgi:hypothetical protein